MGAGPAAVVVMVALLSVACSAGSATPQPTVTVTETATVTTTIAVPQEGLIDPLLDQTMADICLDLDNNEPSWDSMQEYGPYEDYPIQADMVARAAKRANEAYRRAFERILSPDIKTLPKTEAYGRLNAYLSDRSAILGALEYAANDYLDGTGDYDRLYYFWAAYAASLESGTPQGCGNYLD
jgi:hypothetical protein